jgi:hypothetical protein
MSGGRPESKAVAISVTAESVWVLAWAVPYRSRVEGMLVDGFEVERDGPAAQIMARLVRDGVAVRMTEREARR